MIDVHSHILPGVDDGAPDWDGCLAMMALAALGGTTRIVATPHSPDIWRSERPCREAIPELVDEANRLAATAGLELHVESGQECMIDVALISQLESGELLTLAGSRTVLLELPFVLWPPFAEDLIFDLQLAGYTVLLAHPERYRAVAEDPNRLLPLVERGVLMQITSTSIMGLFGEKTRELSRLLLDHNLGHVVASDSHTTRGRNPNMRAAWEQICEWYDEERAQALFVDTPRALLADEPVALAEPRRIEPRRKKIFGLF